MDERFAFYSGELEPELILATTNLYTNGCLYDCGASIGLYSCTFGNHAKAFGGYIRAIEPMSANINILRSQLTLNDLSDSDVRVHHLAVSDEAGTLEIAFTGDTPGNARVNETYGEKESVRCVTLDELWTQNDRESVGFIKVDCEGWDGRIIWGGRDMIRECQPVILAECQRIGMERAGYEMPELWGFLVAELDYRCFRVGERGQLISISEPGTLENLVFVPADSASITAIEPRGQA